MDDFIFKILCRGLYKGFYDCDYEDEFNLSSEEVTELEKQLSYQYFTNPDRYSKMLEEWDMKEFIERWNWSLTNTVST